MGKGMRNKEERAAAEPKVIGTIAVNLLSDGKVTVSGPIGDPSLVCNTISKMIHALIQFYTQQAKDKDRNKV